jgi:hypothetical protein
MSKKIISYLMVVLFCVSIAQAGWWQDRKDRNALPQQKVEVWRLATEALQRDQFIASEFGLPSSAYCNLFRALTNGNKFEAKRKAEEIVEQRKAAKRLLAQAVEADEAVSAKASRFM